MLGESVAYAMLIVIILKRKQILCVCYIKIVVTCSNISKLNCDDTYIKYILK